MLCIFSQDISLIRCFILFWKMTSDLCLHNSRFSGWRKYSNCFYAQFTLPSEYPTAISLSLENEEILMSFIVNNTYEITSLYSKTREFPQIHISVLKEWWNKLDKEIRRIFEYTHVICWSFELLNETKKSIYWKINICWASRTGETYNSKNSVACIEFSHSFYLQKWYIFLEVRLNSILIFWNFLLKMKLRFFEISEKYRISYYIINEMNGITSIPLQKLWNNNPDFLWVIYLELWVLRNG